MDAKTEQKTVLIVEDEKNIVDILRFNLQREGYRTVEAYDGADGLDKARKENPDIILLDVMLPKMIGFDVCRTLREEGNNVPVIILTAREEEADKVLAERAKAGILPREPRKGFYKLYTDHALSAMKGAGLE